MSRSLLGAALLGALLAPRPTAAVEPFTLAVIGDQQRPVDRDFHTQWYSSFTAQTDWLAANAHAKNIRFVVQVGDIVEHGSDGDEWNRAAAAMAVLDDAVNADGGVGIPWSVAYGNHERDLSLGSGPAGAPADRYREYFGGADHSQPHRYNGQFGFGGVSFNELNTYHFIKTSDRADAREYLLLTLEYDVPGHPPGTSPPSNQLPTFDAIAWAQSIIDRNPGKPTIISTHVFEGTQFGPPTEPWDPGPGRNSQLEIFDKLVKNNPQVFLILSGHTSQDTHQVKTNAEGDPVLQISTDYNKVLPNGGDGFMRLIEIDEDMGEIRVNTFSPGVPQNPTPRFRNDSNSKFTVPFGTETASDLDPPLPRNSLLAHWRMDEASDSTEVVDSAGIWPIGTIEAVDDGLLPQFFPGKVGNALEFDGFDDIVSVPFPNYDPPLNLSGPLTISAWVDIEGDPTGITGHIAGQDSPRLGGLEDGFYLKYHRLRDAVVFGIARAPDVGDNRVELMSGTKLTDADGFVHVAGVFEPGESMKLYLNGELDAELTSGVPEAAQRVATPLTIGRLHDDQGHATFHGLIDDVQLYGRALDAREIRSMFNNPGMVVPEPSTSALAVLGLIGWVVTQRKE